MALIDPPQKVVNAIIWSSIHRRKELQTGWKARSSYIFHRMFPHFTERLSANVAHKYQIKNAPPAPPTTGAIYEPMQSGRGVDDGVKARIKREKKEQKERKNK